MRQLIDQLNVEKHRTRRFGSRISDNTQQILLIAGMLTSESAAKYGNRT